MTFRHREMAKRFITIMERAGADVEYHVAGTGTIYVTVEVIFKVRFADHGECYCREDMSVDPDGYSLMQAVSAAGDMFDLDVSRSLAAFKAAASRARRQRAEWEARADLLYEPYMQREKARLAFQRDFIASRYPDYETRPPKSRKRVRAKANKEFAAQYA